MLCPVETLKLGVSLPRISFPVYFGASVGHVGIC